MRLSVKKMKTLLFFYKTMTTKNTLPLFFHVRMTIQRTCRYFHISRVLFCKNTINVFVFFRVPKLATKIFSAIAQEFNNLQNDSGIEDDGHRLYACSNYHSAVLVIQIKLPEDNQKMLASTMRNVKKAIQNLGLTTYAESMHRKQFMHAHMTSSKDSSSPSNQFPFHLCSSGQGVVHAFDVRLA